ncbi:uncharacterized protein MCYG_01010 [Microsporum canis CBS 113480]|uniref:Uncharacterized protein n=1 Tax=Arthroderma otae (strain ATCC MYA-4605 / CBS 113480) TaxID=554155 RepID=C5FE88_ARTOC|nr:uncharacterized protein MCYG_01010 [Microsporum canis CBS 113480]EEQ28122.1 predicted protein [Microsporum canis CBS 113480]
MGSRVYNANHGKQLTMYANNGPGPSLRFRMCKYHGEIGSAESMVNKKNYVQESHDYQHTVTSGMEFPILILYFWPGVARSMQLIDYDTSGLPHLSSWKAKPLIHRVHHTFIHTYYGFPPYTTPDDVWFFRIGKRKGAFLAQPYSRVAYIIQTQHIIPTDGPIRKQRAKSYLKRNTLVSICSSELEMRLFAGKKKHGRISKKAASPV